MASMKDHHQQGDWPRPTVHWSRRSARRRAPDPMAHQRGLDHSAQRIDPLDRPGGEHLPLARPRAGVVRGSRTVTTARSATSSSTAPRPSVNPARSRRLYQTALATA